jgi:hypothetical protein
MDEAIVVETADHVDQLSKYVFCISLGEPAVLLDAFK